MLTLKRFRRIEAAVRAAGYDDTILWSGDIPPPMSADAFAEEAVYVICNSGMRNIVAIPIHRRCMAAVRDGRSATTVFGHPGKAAAIDEIWQRREALFEAYQAAGDKVAYLHGLPWIGPVTRHHLAKNFGIDTAKPDVHLERLAAWEGKSTDQLCRRLSRLTGYRVATIDTILWQACADGILNSRIYAAQGWRKAFNGKPTYIPIEDAEELTQQPD